MTSKVQSISAKQMAYAVPPFLLIITYGLTELIIAASKRQSISWEYWICGSGFILVSLSLIYVSWLLQIGRLKRVRRSLSYLAITYLVICFATSLTEFSTATEIYNHRFSDGYRVLGVFAIVSGGLLLVSTFPISWFAKKRLEESSERLTNSSSDSE
jgi:bacteriorhodopsin